LPHDYYAHSPDTLATDDPCLIALAATGLVARIGSPGADGERFNAEERDQQHDVA
jgi:hypothetical protein